MLRYSSESHAQYRLEKTALNEITTQVWAMQITWGWNKDIDGQKNSGPRSSLVCLRAGEGVPLSAAVALHRPSLFIMALVMFCVI